MLKQFEVNITKNILFTKADKLLIAFSGGVDSMVLADLLVKTGYDIELAHCNFQLRGNEANEDTAFCKNYAEGVNTKLHIINFDTKTYAAKNKLSLQMAARELRYNWFKKLKVEFGFNYILTAHHLTDNIETLFVNLIRGTGIKGLEGIPEKQNDIIRPLLFATKEDIIHYATEQKLSYREDSSNVEVKYKRNFIRHNILPELKKLNPSLEETLHTSMQFFKQSSEIVSQFSAQKYKEICKVENGLLYINIELLLIEKQKETLLFEWLYKSHFKSSHISQLYSALALGNCTGKQFLSDTHQLVVDRKYLIIKAIEKDILPSEFIINSLDDVHNLPIKLHFEETTDQSFSDNKNEIIIPYLNSTFPLTLRKWRQGDKFKPFGVNGFKKVSDFFKDQKLSLFEKEAAWILENKEHIVWVVGYRMDDRCKVVERTERILRVTIN